jgi:hypothetical protein
MYLILLNDMNNKKSTYGDEYEHPSSITRRIEDPVNGGIDPHQRSDESNDDWAYDMLDVNEIGQSRDMRGDDQVKEKNKKANKSKDKKELTKDQEKALEKFFTFLPLITEFFHSEESGMNDPIIQSVHEALEGNFPGYLDGEFDSEMFILLPEEENKKKGNLIRFHLHLSKPENGHVFIVEKEIFYNIPQGNVYRWNNLSAWHAGTNCGIVPKYLFSFKGYQ